LEEDGAGEGLADGEAEILEDGGAEGVGVADFDDGVRGGGVGEERAVAGEGGPGVSHQAGSGGDGEGGCEAVDSVGEVGDFLGRGGEVEAGLEGDGVVALAVAVDRVAAVLGGVFEVDYIRSGGFGVLGRDEDGISAVRC
jgi:hypothetical protein